MTGDTPSPDNTPRADVQPAAPHTKSAATPAGAAKAVAEDEAVWQTLGQDHSPAAWGLVWGITGLMIAALVWAAVAEVPETVSAPGRVRPASHIQTVNHPLGGQVTALFVADGDRVEKGAPLLTLDPELLNAELARLEGEWQHLAATVARLEAESADPARKAAPVFDAPLAETRPDLVDNQNQLWAARRQAMAARQAAGESIVTRREAEIFAQTERVEQLEHSLAILKRQEAAIGSLAEKGHFPELRYLSVQREVAELEGSLNEERENLTAAYAALAEAKGRRASTDREEQAAILGELAHARAERDRLAGLIAEKKTQQTRLVIKSPGTGIVQDLAVTGTGQTVAAGTPLLTVVPVGDALVVEANISNLDIGHITSGQKATVKVLAYDFIRYGVLEGEITRVSAAAAPPDPETGRRDFQALVITERNYLGDTPGEQPVQPGMEVVVDVELGRRSILAYFTDRLKRTSKSAFREP